MILDEFSRNPRGQRTGTTDTYAGPINLDDFAKVGKKPEMGKLKYNTEGSAKRVFNHPDPYVRNKIINKINNDYETAKEFNIGRDGVLDPNFYKRSPKEPLFKDKAVDVDFQNKQFKDLKGMALGKKPNPWVSLSQGQIDKDLSIQNKYSDMAAQGQGQMLSNQMAATGGVTQDASSRVMGSAAEQATLNRQGLAREAALQKSNIGVAGAEAQQGIWQQLPQLQGQQSQLAQSQDDLNRMGRESLDENRNRIASSKLAQYGGKRLGMAYDKIY
jgi:hypothetical protein